MNKFRARSIKEFKDEEAIKMAEKKKRDEMALKDPLAESLKRQGNIEEAAAVFSYEGMKFMFDMMGDIISKKLEPMIDTKITEILKGMQTGMAQAITEVAKEGIEKSMNFGTSDEVWKQEAATASEANYIHKYSEYSMLDGKASEAEVEIPMQVQENIEIPIQEEIKTPTKMKLPDETYEKTYTGYDIPRNQKGIYWSRIDEEHTRQIILFYVALAAEHDAIQSSGRFKKFHRDAQGIYQRMVKLEGRGAWDKFKAEYLEKYAPGDN